MTLDEIERMERLERALRVIWTWANYDRARLNFVELNALAAKEE